MFWYGVLGMLFYPKKRFRVATLPSLPSASRFGAMLDMLTDRCATMCLLVVLASFYPAHMFSFQLLMVIDIASHWIHLHRYAAAVAKLPQARRSHPGGPASWSPCAVLDFLSNKCILSPALVRIYRLVRRNGFMKLAPGFLYLCHYEYVINWTAN